MRSRAVRWLSILALLTSAGAIWAASGRHGSAAEPVQIDYFRVSRTPIDPGSRSNLEWQTQNATECTLVDWRGQSSVDVHQKGPPPPGYPVQPMTTTTYELSCRNADTTAVRYVTIDVKEPVTILYFNAQPDTVAANEKVTLSWSSTRSIDCFLNDSVDPVGPGGHADRYPAHTTLYQLACTGNGGPAVKSVLATVVRPAAVARLTATPNVLKRGEQSAITWATEGSTDCILDPAAVPVAPNGTMRTTISATTTFVLTCKGKVGEPAVAKAGVIASPDPTARAKD